MKLRSVEQRELPLGPATVLVDDLSYPYDLSHFASGTLFTEFTEQAEHSAQPEHLHLNPDAWVVGINLDPETLSALAIAAHAAGCSRVSYWVNTAGAKHLNQAVETQSDLAIDGVTPLGEWTVFDLVEATSSDKPGTEFLSGLLTGQRLQPPPAEKAPIENTEPQRSRRGAALAQVVHLAKPLKPYLPPQVIHLGYKALGALS